ncbi:MAG: AAA family ATPase [Actinobacteria bacterium]|nr:AAA family ATPase [Actinomycetota bacterium]
MRNYLDSSYIREVQIRNYKSIAPTTVKLTPLTVFVGPNGSGKSNFIDSLAFVQECVSESIEYAFTNRGGIGAVRRRSGGHPTNIGFRIILNLKDRDYAEYSFEIAAKPRENFYVAKERCYVKPFMQNEYEYELEKGEFIKEISGIRPKMPPGRLALYAASATDEFGPVYDFLSRMRFYSIVPNQIRELQSPDPGEFLKRDGSNAATILKRLYEEARTTDKYDRICRLLSRVASGIERVEYRQVGQKETLQFKQDIGLRNLWTFEALNMSDGTLRVLGLLLAVYQSGKTSLVAIEEPESTVHPAVTELIMQVLRDASLEKQILITTHSPDILDYKELKDEQIRVVIMEQGNTKIAPLADSSKEAIKEKLYTPGELLRIDELQPDLEIAQNLSKRLNLFGQPKIESDYQ